MFHTNQSYMDIRRDGRAGWKAAFNVQCVLNTQVFGGGIFATFQRHLEFFYSSPSCSSLLKLLFPFFSFLYDDMTIFLFTQSSNCSSHWLGFFFPSWYFLSCPSTQFWILISSVSIVISITVISTWNFLFIYCLLTVCLSTMALVTSIRIERLTVWLFLSATHRKAWALYL